MNDDIAPPSVAGKVHVQPHEHDIYSVLVDGLPGSGKSLLAPLVSSLAGAERWRVSEALEAVVGLNAVGQLSDEAGLELLALICLSLAADTAVSREVNLRPREESGLLRNPHRLRTLIRLLSSDNDVYREFIRRGPSLVFGTHAASPNMRFLDRVPQIKVVAIVRRPMETLIHHATYLERIQATRNRDFQIQIEHASPCPVGWQLASVPQELLSDVRGPVDVAALTIAHVNGVYREHAVSGRCVVTFRDVAHRTSEVLDRISEFTGRAPSRQTRAMLRRLGLPRRTVSWAGAEGHPAYGWRLGSTEHDARGLLERMSPRIRDVFLSEDDIWRDCFGE